MKTFEILILNHAVTWDGVRWDVKTNSAVVKEQVWRYMWAEGFFELC